MIFSAVTALGLVRLPDVYTRTHAASKSSTLGVMGILTGVFLHFWLKEDVMAPQLIIATVFLFITSPVAGHLIGRASYMSGIQLAKETVRDDMKVLLEEKQENK